MTPNPLLERTRNGKASWPRDALVYDAPRGQGALSPRAAQLRTLDAHGTNRRLAKA